MNAYHLVNRIPTKKHNTILFDFFFEGRKPNLNYLKVWRHQHIMRTPEHKKGGFCLFTLDYYSKFLNLP